MIRERYLIRDWHILIYQEIDTLRNIYRQEKVYREISADNSPFTNQMDRRATRWFMATKRPYVNLINLLNHGV